MGKNTIAQIALGRTPEEEYKDNLRNISKVTDCKTVCKC
jgi:ribosomal protein L10